MKKATFLCYGCDSLYSSYLVCGKIEFEIYNVIIQMQKVKTQRFKIEKPIKLLKTKIETKWDSHKIFSNVVKITQSDWYA